MWLDLIRGVAAVIVAGSHLQRLLFVDKPDLPASTHPLVRVLYFVTDYDKAAVTVFFVLSGYLIAGSVATSLQKGTWDYRNYALTRLSRLLCTLLPALAAGAILDAIGLSIFGSDGIYHGGVKWGNILGNGTAERTSALTYLGNIFFLQTVFVGTAGSNASLWSLANEFCYYFLFMFAVMLFQPGGTSARKAVAAGGFAFLTYIYWEQVRYGLHLWLLGAGVVALERIFTRTRLPGQRYLAALAGICGISMFALLGFRKLPGGMLAVGIAASGILFAIATFNGAVSATRPWQGLQKLAKWLADFSYSLYTSHLPLIVLVCAMLTPTGRMVPTAFNLMKYAGAFTVMILWARLLFFLAESRTPQVRAWALRFFRVEVPKPRRFDEKRNAA